MKITRLGIIIAIVFVIVGVVLNITIKDKWFLGTIFLTAGICYFISIPIDKYYANKKQNNKKK